MKLEVWVKNPMIFPHEWCDEHPSIITENQGTRADPPCESDRRKGSQGATSTAEASFGHVIEVAVRRRNGALKLGQFQFGPEM